MSFISISRAPVSLAALHHVRNAGIDDHQIPDNSVIVPKRKIVGRKGLARRAPGALSFCFDLSRASRSRSINPMAM